MPQSLWSRAAWIKSSDRHIRTPKHGDSKSAGASLSADGTHPNTFPDPNAPGTSARVVVRRSEFDGDMFDTAVPFMGPIRDARSLDDLRESRRGRGRRGIAALRARFSQLPLEPPLKLDEVRNAIKLARSIGLLYMHEGKLTDAASWLDRALQMSRRPDCSPEIAANFHAQLGIASLRRGEIENCLECLGPSSCIFPLDPLAIHTEQSGSREAVRQFASYLEWAPGDLRVRWLLNLAYMTLGEYPKKCHANISSHWNHIDRRSTWVVSKMSRRESD